MKWQNIDILLINALHRLVIIIENKIDTSEHHNQLERYYKTVADHFPGWTTLALYLTPDKHRPSDPRYQAIGYGLICQVVEDLLCRQVYREHEQAINSITRYRQQRQMMIRDYFESLVANSSEKLKLNLDQRHVNGHIYFSRFALLEWSMHRDFGVANGWTKSKLIMLFQFIHSPGQIGIDLAVGSGPTAAPMRQRLFDVAREHQPPFSNSRDLSSKYFGIYGRSVLSAETGYFETYSDSEIKDAIRENWDAFRNYDLPQIRSVIKQQILDSPTPVS